MLGALGVKIAVTMMAISCNISIKVSFSVKASKIYSFIIKLEFHRMDFVKSPLTSMSDNFNDIPEANTRCDESATVVYIVCLRSIKSIMQRVH